MKVEHIHKGKRYIFSNDNLIEGDETFPIARGRVGPNNEFIYHGFQFEGYMTGFPDDSHTILNLKHAPEYKPYEVQTNHGFGPIESYFKIVAIEEIKKPLKLSEILNGKK